MSYIATIITKRKRAVKAFGAKKERNFTLAIKYEKRNKEQAKRPASENGGIALAALRLFSAQQKIGGHPEKVGEEDDVRRLRLVDAPLPIIDGLLADADGFGERGPRKVLLRAQAFNIFRNAVLPLKEIFLKGLTKKKTSFRI